MDEKLISIGEAAKTLGVSIDTLRRWDKSGILSSFRANATGHRYYPRSALSKFVRDLFHEAEQWVTAKYGNEPDPGYYCSTSDVFQNRIVRMQNELAGIKNLATPFPLIVAVAGEIGNNSFDHNLGNWRDVPGIFFGYDLRGCRIVLADRGQGILKTLQRVRPGLKNESEAVETAFTEVISGRAPEARGNGLKFVRKIITANPMTLLFQSGDAKLTIGKGDTGLHMEVQNSCARGCLAVIQF